MPNLHQSFSELKLTATYLCESISRTESLMGSNNHCWNNFLIHLQLIWKKLYYGVEDIKERAYPFLGNKAKEIKQSPLLNYFIKARNASEHSCKPLIGSIPVHERHRLVALMEYVPVGGNQIEIMPIRGQLSRLIALPIIDRDGIHNPPIHFNGQRLSKEDDPIEMGIIAITYYFGLLKEFDLKFNNKILLNDLSKFFSVYNFAKLISENKQTFYIGTSELPNVLQLKTTPLLANPIRSDLSFIDANGNVIESHGQTFK
ncbi:hypothetical protein [Niabella sp.]|uniref:hypothetical protein n=1 Tax=Niabella sp. TaxID=1962976 RepID=UPI0026062F4F|nr:hypothetical protein [Niabella sp.]